MPPSFQGVHSEPSKLDTKKVGREGTILPLAIFLELISRLEIIRDEQPGVFLFTIPTLVRVVYAHSVVVDVFVFISAREVRQVLEESVTLSVLPRKAKRVWLICGQPAGGGILSSDGWKWRYVVRKM
jgi:hypothetical protein